MKDRSSIHWLERGGWEGWGRGGCVEIQQPLEKRNIRKRGQGMGARDAPLAGWQIELKSQKIPRSPGGRLHKIKGVAKLG